MHSPPEKSSTGLRPRRRKNSGRQPRCVSYEDWLKLNEIEVQRGRAQGRPRVKLTRVEEMLAALGR